LDIPNKLKDAVDQFSKIPGIGNKTALRQCLHLTNWGRTELVNFGAAISALADINRCEDCGVFCDDERCSVCMDHKREKTICVVETINDYMAIENSNQYRGLYHVLGGVLNPLLGIGPDSLSIDKLKERVLRLEVNHLILAVNPSVEGDATCAFLKQVLPASIQIDRIGFGIPIGGSLEYVDSLTISKALENRKKM
jgi:recombination protein RecR